MSEPRFLVLATDYDGTLAKDGFVDDWTIHSLMTWRNAGRRLVLVTGRELPDLFQVFPRVELFDFVVAENGALLFDPAMRTELPLAEPPPRAFTQALRAANITPLSIGRVIVGTLESQAEHVLALVRDLGLELELIFNKGSLMVLPSGTNKASGLKKALERMHIDPSRVIGVGDAENDHSLAQSSGLFAAVANAIGSLKAHADVVTEAHHGAGVSEVVRRALAGDFDNIASIGKRDLAKAR